MFGGRVSVNARMEWVWLLGSAGVSSAGKSYANLICPWSKRRRAAAVQDAVRGTMMLGMREASWSAPALWRSASRRKVREI